MPLSEIFSRIIILVFSETVMVDWLTGNSTSCRLLRSVIILVIDKSDSRFSVVRFCKSSYVRDRILLHSVLLPLFMPKKIGDERYLLITSELGGKRTQVSVATRPLRRNGRKASDWERTSSNLVINSYWRKISAITGDDGLKISDLLM